MEAPPPQSLSLNLHSSTRVSLTSKKLSSVPLAELAPVASALRALDLSSNTLGASEPFVLPPALPLLEELRLHDNVLDAIAVQKAAPLPPSLRVLDLSANRLALFPPCLLRLPVLTVLKLDRQRLRALPPELSLLSELHELDVGFNELASALELATPGLPRLRRLVLRSNGLTSAALRFDAATLPSLTDLDLAGNLCDEWPGDVGNLESLRTLNLASNRFTSLVSAATVAHRRLWVPASGIHTLAMLAELSVAQNSLVDLPASLSHMRALRRLDVRCNPLSAQSVALATEHCKQCGARLLASALSRVGPGLVFGDESSAWHRPTLLRAQVSRIVSVGGAPPDGVAAARLEAKLPVEFSALGLGGGGPSGEGGEGGVVTVESLRRAFHAKALATHPDKQPEPQRVAAAETFGQLKEAYRALGRAVAMERRRLPHLDGFSYAFIELPAAAGAPERLADEAALLDAFRAQLPAALAFAREGRAAADGDLLIHPAGGAAVPCALAAALALIIDQSEATLSVADAGATLHRALGRDVLAEVPPALRAELECLAADRRRPQVVVERGARLSSSDAPASASGGRSYAPNLSMVDPFGGDMSLGGGLDMNLGGLSIDDGATLSLGGIDLSDAASSAAAAPTTAEAPPVSDEGRRGWSTDADGQTVLLVPGGKRYSKIIVEYEEGARIDSSAGRGRTRRSIG